MRKRLNRGPTEARESGESRGPLCCSSLAQASPESLAGLRKDDWNEYVITARGNHITLYLNGKRTVDSDSTETPDVTLELTADQYVRLIGAG